MKKLPLNVFIIAMMNIVAICNIANLSISAENGFTALFYLGVALLFFFIPVALVSAELASAWPQRGIYVWVKEAFGTKMGFLAIWLQWVENIVWIPAPLSFLASTIAYVFNPSLVENKLYIFCLILAIFWIITFINLFGIKISGWISSFCGVAGTLIPGILIIAFGFIWWYCDYPSDVIFTTSNLFPSNNYIQQIGFLAAILMSLGGLEMSANHAREVENPQKSYPKAIFISAFAIFAIYALGSLSVAIIVPHSQINLAAASMESIKIFLDLFNLRPLIPIFAFLVAIGTFGLVSTWVVGPIRGVLATAENGDIPPLLQKTNKKNMPTSLLIMQAIIVSFLSLVYLVMPSVSSSYLILIVLGAQLYLVMYIIMFISAIVLRYKQPNVERAFKVPFKNIGIWLVGLIGALSATFGILTGFLPPDDSGVNFFYFDLFLLVGLIVFIAMPILIIINKHPGWKQHFIDKISK